MIAPAAITLGVLAGGRGARFGGADKAWLDDHGEPSLARCLAQFDGPFANGFAARLVSARAADARHAALSVTPVLDRAPGFRGPVAALAALAHACTTPWLLTVPVDTRDLPASLPERLAGAGGREGACLVDADGLQPLLALWPAAALAAVADAALADDDASARQVVDALGLARVVIAPARLRNLNTPADLAASTR